MPNIFVCLPDPFVLHFFPPWPHPECSPVWSHQYANRDAQKEILEKIGSEGRWGQMKANYVLASFPAGSPRAGWVPSPELRVPLKLAYPTQFSLPGYGHIPYASGSSCGNRSGVLHFIYDFLYSALALGNSPFLSPSQIILIRIYFLFLAATLTNTVTKSLSTKPCHFTS